MSANRRQKRARNLTPVERDAIRLVRCPVCGQPPGKPCRAFGDGGPSYFPHPVRVTELTEPSP